MKLFKKNEKKETLCKDTSMPFGKKEETTKLPMTGKVRKGFHFYCVMVMAGAMVLGTSMTESIVVSMLYQVLFTVGNAVIFTDEYIGITEVTSLLFGDVLVV